MPSWWENRAPPALDSAQTQGLLEWLAGPALRRGARKVSLTQGRRPGAANRIRFYDGLVKPETG